MVWVEVARVDQVADGTGILVRHGRRDVLIFRTGDAWTAYDNLCPHAGAPMHPQHYDGACVLCTYHGLRFRSSDGVCPEAPGWRLEPIPIRVEGERIFLGTEES